MIRDMDSGVMGIVKALGENRAHSSSHCNIIAVHLAVNFFIAFIQFSPLNRM